jgi:hypothetical protein
MVGLGLVAAVFGGSGRDDPAMFDVGFSTDRPERWPPTPACL